MRNLVRSDGSNVETVLEEARALLENLQSLGSVYSESATEIQNDARNISFSNWEDDISSKIQEFIETDIQNSMQKVQSDINSGGFNSLITITEKIIEQLEACVNVQTEKRREESLKERYQNQYDREISNYQTLKRFSMASSTYDGYIQYLSSSIRQLTSDIANLNTQLTSMINNANDLFQKLAAVKFGDVVRNLTVKTNFTKTTVGEVQTIPESSKKISAEGNSYSQNAISSQLADSQTYSEPDSSLVSSACADSIPFVQQSTDERKAEITPTQINRMDAETIRKQEEYAALPEAEVEEIEPAKQNTTPEFKMEVIDGCTYVDGTLIANKSYALPSTYNPGGLTSDTMSAYLQMAQAASAAGYTLQIYSGFRSYENQAYTYNYWCNMDGQEAADTYSARPGYSEHQTGMAIDLTNDWDGFGSTAQAKWLNDNAYQYGFILRYPQGKENITGYEYEPWHYRYVGIPLATTLYNNGDWIALEEYYGIDSKYSRKTR